MKIIAFFKYFLGFGLKFRYDINGLRAYAVIAVVLFHFNTSWVSGGFAGVDVFFVISGFLMTAIIFNGLEKNKFNLFDFYVARANRIIPALAVLCIVLLLLGWFFLSPIDYQALAKHAASSLSFISNIIYWKESGYFDADSYEKFLLHTWSLSVEWQFYIIYPAVLIFLNRYFSINSLRRLILLGSVLGFFVCVYATIKSPNSSYYLLPTRAWEMMFGGVAYLYPLTLRDAHKKIVEMIGLSLILTSYIFIDATIAWPGYFAFLPVFGTFIILLSDRQSSIITNNVAFQLLGKWSYSIYLWHWPIVVLGHYLKIDSWWLIGLPLSVLLGFISFKYIESIDFKYISYFSGKFKFKFKFMWLVLIIISFGLYVYSNDGIVDRYSGEDKLLVVSSVKSQGDWSYPAPNLYKNKLELRYIEGTNGKNVLFIGASHIAQTYPYVSSLENSYNVYYLTKGGCFVTPSMTNDRWSCANLQNYKEILSDIKFDKIVTSFYFFDGYLPTDNKERELEISKRVDEYDEFIEVLKKNAKSVFLIKGEPRGEAFDPKYATRYGLDDFILESEVLESYRTHELALARLKSLDGVTIINPIDYLCSNGVCKTRNNENEFFYKDIDHMRPWYSRKNSTYLSDIFK